MDKFFARVFVDEDLRVETVLASCYKTFNVVGGNGAKTVTLRPERFKFESCLPYVVSLACRRIPDRERVANLLNYRVFLNETEITTVIGECLVSIKRVTDLERGKILTLTKPSI